MVVPSSSKREQVLSLIQEKENLEKQINEYGEVLKRNNVGMNDELVTADSFPRNDIDVYQIRHARHQIICLQNDLKALMKTIEKGLEEIHAEEASFKDHTKYHNQPREEGSVSQAPQEQRKPILLVTSVDPIGPAAESGVVVRDQILEFGTINDGNFENLSQISELVRHSANQSIALKIKRGSNTVDVTLIRRTGHGLGFSIDVIKE